MGRRRNPLFTLIFGVFFLGFLGFFASQVIRLTFGNSSGLPDPVASTAFVLSTKKETITYTPAPGKTTGRTSTKYYVVASYEDGEVTRRTTLTVSEQVYAKYEEGDTIPIYYYPGRELSGYGSPPRANATSDFDRMKQLIGVFMLFIAGFMAVNFIGGLVMPHHFRRSQWARKRHSSISNSSVPTADDLRDRFGDRD